MNIMEKVIAVIDMRAFYPFVECVDRGLDPYNAPLVVADKNISTDIFNIDDENYLNQLMGYKTFIKNKTKKDVSIYLYSINCF